MNQVELKFNGKNIIGYWRDEADESVWAEIFKWREYRKVEPLIQEAMNPILDVGAHAGFFALYASSLNPQAKIICIEPEPSNIEWLEKHLQINKIKGVKVISGALSDSTDQANLLFSSDSHNHRLVRSSDGSEKTIKVKTYSFGDLVKNTKIELFGLVKIDIEGGEYQVMRSWGEDEWNKIENLILEYHDIDNDHHSELEMLMRQNGFSVQKFPSKFEKTMGFFFAHNKRIK